MGLFRRRPQSTDDGPNELEQLRSELTALKSRVDESDAAKAALEGRVRALDDRLATPISSPPPPPEPVRSIDPAQVDMLNARVARLVERLDAVDVRITTVSTELANQLAELGNDIDTLSNASDDDGEATDAGVEMSQVLDIALETLRDAQNRLANEQARYQIAFRHDLAELAERLKRPAG